MLLTLELHCSTIEKSPSDKEIFIVVSNHKSMAEEYNLSIPASLAKKIKERIEGTAFDSISHYVTYVLRELLAEDEKENELTKEDEEKIKERLRALGYLN